MMKRLGLLALFTCTAAVLLHAQGDSLRARVRALNGQIIRLHGLVQAAAPAQAAALRGQAGPLEIWPPNAIEEQYAAQRDAKAEPASGGDVFAQENRRGDYQQRRQP